MTNVCNIILLGDSGVGKSAFVLRLMKGYFSQSYITTLGTDYCKYEYNGTVINIFDTAGQERFSAICSTYYKKANGVIVLYDVKNNNSLKNVSKWIEKLHRFVEDIPIIICANKIDLLDTIYTPPSNLQFEYTCLTISCKTGENTDKVLPALIPDVNTNEIISSNLETLMAYVPSVYNPCYML
jgi:small GTP-binding protein